MGMCKSCGEVRSALDMIDGYCQDCSPTNTLFSSQAEKDELTKQLKENRVLSNSVTITTESFINEPIEHRLGIISSECVYGVNLVKDIFSFVRDIVSGRIESLESALKDANNTIVQDLKDRAYLMGGNAVIGVKIEHTYNNSGNGNILSVFATGTVVKLA